MKFQIFMRNGQFYWRLRARNGKIVAQSKGYKTYRKCRNTVELVRSEAFYAEVVTLS